MIDKDVVAQGRHHGQAHGKRPEPRRPRNLDRRPIRQQDDAGEATVALRRGGFRTRPPTLAHARRPTCRTHLKIESPSSPAPAAASAAASRYLMAEEGAKVVVNDPGVGPDGGGTDDGPADQVVAEIKPRRRQSRRQPRLRRHDGRRREHHPDRARQVRPHRHPRQQRRHPPRPHDLQHERAGVGRGHRRPPQGPLRDDQARLRPHAPAALRPHHQLLAPSPASGATPGRPTTAPPSPPSPGSPASSPATSAATASPATPSPRAPGRASSPPTPAATATPTPSASTRSSPR